MSEWFERFGFGAVGDSLLTGAYPLDADDVAALAAAGVDEVYNLCEDVEYGDGERAAVAAALAAAGITERRLSLTDYGNLPAPALERATMEVCAALAVGRRVYLHCRAGWQRSAAVAAGVIALREGLTIGGALDRLRERRPAAEPLAHQTADLLAWWEGRGG
ncbi:MAG: histidinol-phosphate aminotransferase [Solirubrobacteraceae bacterium]|jgi:protein-tyrosine phosphatase|nr:histidinol-phosphate aminotransferase [Solirubrobacteraceae bacterium]